MINKVTSLIYAMLTTYFPSQSFIWCLLGKLKGYYTFSGLISNWWRFVKLKAAITNLKWKAKYYLEFLDHN